MFPKTMVGWSASLIALTLTASSAAAFVQQGFRLAGPDGLVDSQGRAVALSGDGNTLVSADENNRAAWVFVRDGLNWSQQGGKLVPTDAVGNALQGYSAAISGDGNTILMGGPGDSNFEGAAWVFTRSGATWTQQAKLVGTGDILAPGRGTSVALSSDGNTAVIGGPNDNSGVGAAWVFTRSGATWTQEAKLFGAVAIGLSRQGSSVAVSADGNTAILGGPDDNNRIGASWVFQRLGTLWSQEDKLVGLPTSSLSYQGSVVAVSGDGSTAMVGAWGRNTVWAFTRSDLGWAQQDRLVGAAGSGRGGSFAVSGNGDLAVLAESDSVSVFRRTVGQWAQDRPNLAGRDHEWPALLGRVALSADATTIAAAGYMRPDSTWGGGGSLSGVWIFFEEGICEGSGKTSTTAPPVSLWDAGVGSFEIPSNWLPEGIPGPSYRIRFPNLPQMDRIVALGSSPTTLDIDVSHGPVTLQLNNQTWRPQTFEGCVRGRALQVVGSDDQHGVLTVQGPGNIETGGNAFLDPGIMPSEGGASTLLKLTNGAALVVPTNRYLTLGPDASSAVPDARPFSSIEISGGSSLRTPLAFVGAATGQLGVVSIEGQNSFWDGQSVLLGTEGGEGRLVMVDGARATLGNVTCGYLPSSRGEIFVGAGSQIVATKLELERGEVTTLTGGSIKVDNLFEASGNGSVMKIRGGTVTALNLSAGTEGDVQLEIAGSSPSNPSNLVTSFAFLANGAAAGRARTSVTGAWSLFETRELMAGTVGEATITLGDGAVLACRGLAKLGGAPGSRAELRANGAGTMAVFNRLDLAFPTGTAHIIGDDGAVVIATHGRTGPDAHLNFSGILVGVPPPPPGSGSPRVPVAGGTAGSSFYCDTLTVMPGATITADSLVLSANGVIQGEGSLALPLVNNGFLTPGTDAERGTLTVATDYVQTTNGRLGITLGAPHDRLVVNGSATLAGALEIDVAPPLAEGEFAFEVVVGHPVIGTFESVPDSVVVSYTDTSVVVTYATTPTLVSLASVSVDEDGVRLAWFAASPAVQVAEVNRRTEQSEWSRIGEASLNGSSLFEFLDTEVTPGTRYGYRLKLQAGGHEEWLGETWVDVPTTATFALAGARPNPASNGLYLAFSLPDRSPAHIEILDVGGRRVLSREVSSLGPGSHVLNLSLESRLKPGVYFARLTSGSRSATSRVVVTD